jgi:hypothetical protein
MVDITSNIIIGISGDSANMGTDYGTDGVGVTLAHLALSKLVWGDNTEGKRVTLTDPLPIQFIGQTSTTNISGTVNAGSTAWFPVRNYGDGTSAGTYYIAVAGNTTGTERVGITGQVQGMVDGTPLTITGGILIMGSQDAARGVAIQGTSAGVTAEVNGEVFPGYGFGVPIAVTGGRRLDSSVDSVNVSGTINSTGGRQLSPSTDSVAVYGYDRGKSVHTILRSSNDGPTAGYTSGYPGGPVDTLQVAIMNAANGITFSVQLQSATAVSNDGDTALRIQGATASSGADPVIVRGQNDGALEVTATSALNTTVGNIVSIDDDDIITSLEDKDKPIGSKLAEIATDTNQIGNIRSDLVSGKIKTIISSIVKPDNLRSGQKSVSNTSSQLHTNLEIKSGVTVKSSPLSSENVLIGHKGLLNSTNSGYLLEPGESIFIEISNLNKIYVRLAGSSGSATVYYIGT